VARYKAILTYDGTGFQGSQRQAKGDGREAPRSRTVQDELEQALRRIGWGGRSIQLAGRTDAGAHAEGQVASFDLDWRHACGQLLKALNAELPPDLAVRSLIEAGAGFHPRFDAVSRLYRYRFFYDPVRHPLREKYAWRIQPPVEESPLHRAAKLFIGTHDFAAFGSPPGAKGTTIRTVIQAGWRRIQPDEWQFEVRAEAFLYRMVRRMTFIQVAAAQGRLAVEEIEAALSMPGRLPAGLAPAHGLTLVDVEYGPE
jgi:tRNA pseudouridine38-40 synthase